MKIEKILTVTYRTLLTKTTHFIKSGGYKICIYLKIFLISHNIKLIQGLKLRFGEIDKTACEIGFTPFFA